jgi:hypothetical protein
MQVVELRGNYAEIEFGNTSDKPLVINNDKLHFVLYDRGGNNIAGSYIVGGSVTIAPNSIEKVIVKAKNPKASSLWLTIGDFEKRITDYSLGESVTDTTPYITTEDYNLTIGGSPIVNSAGVLAGNGKFKFVVEGIQMTNNDKVGPLELPEHLKPNGMIVLVKIKIANTSNEVMSIDDFNEYVYSKETGVQEIALTEDMLKALGPSGLPTTVQPKNIVEGFVPVIINDSQFVHLLQFDTNLGTFIVEYIECIQLLN